MHTAIYVRVSTEGKRTDSQEQELNRYSASGNGRTALFIPIGFPGPGPRATNSTGCSRRPKKPGGTSAPLRMPFRSSSARVFSTKTSSPWEFYFPAIFDSNCANRLISFPPSIPTRVRGTQQNTSQIAPALSDAMSFLPTPRAKRASTPTVLQAERTPRVLERKAAHVNRQGVSAARCR